MSRLEFRSRRAMSRRVAAMSRRVAAMLFLTLLLGVDAGLGGCPCITADLSAYRTADKNKLSFSSGGGSYELPLDYGADCNLHDAETEPSCSNPGCSPSWCSQAWCWVDQANCDQADVQSSAYFPGGPSYSYATCGSVDAFSGFYNLLSTTPRVTGLAHPMVAATSCMYLTSTTAVCGELVPGRTNYNNDWCALKAQVESGALSFTEVLRGRVLDVTIIPADDAYWEEGASGGARLGGMVGDILNWIANDAGFTYRIHAVPKPACMGYTGATAWERWTIDQASRADLIAQWTTDSWQRQSKGVSWPFHHLNLDHVLVVRASGPSLSIEDWQSFVACPSCGSVCIYGGIVKNEMTDLLGADRVLIPPTGYGETQSHEWAADQLRRGGCAAYVQPKARAERMLAQFNAAGGCDLRMLQPSGLPARGGGFAAILPFAREQEARALNSSATSGPGSCTDIAIAAFTRVLQKMHVEAYHSFRAAELQAIQDASASPLQCKMHECESGELDLGAACFRCDERTVDCNQRYMIAVRPRHYRASTNLSASDVLSVGVHAGAKVSARQCTMPEACIGTTAANTSAAMASVADTGSNAACAPGHGGVLCSVCDAGYRRTIRRCEPCNVADPSDLASGASAATTQVAVISTLLLLIFCVVVFLYMRNLSSDLKGDKPVSVVEKPKAPGTHLTGCQFALVLLGKLPWSDLATLLKILLGYVQCMSIFYRLDYVDWPPLFLFFLEWLDFSSLMAVLESITLTDCMASRPIGFSFEFGISLALIPVSALLILLLSLLNALTTPVAAKNSSRLTFPRVSTPQAWMAFEWMLLLCYPLVSRICFQLLDCIEYDGGVTLLRVQPTITCGSDEHVGLRTLAIVIIFLFCVGSPLLVVLASYCAFGPSGTAHRRTFVHLLTDSYRPEFFYFEAVDLIRKLLLSTVTAITFPRTKMQLFFGAVCAGLAVVTFIGVRPYRESWCNFIQGLACLQILLTFVAASVFIRTDVDAATGENNIIAAVMLVVMNILCLLSVPWYACVLWMEARRIAKEMNTPPDPSRPTVWLTSNCLSSDRLKAEFVRLVVMRKLHRQLDYEDTDGRPAETTAGEDLEALLIKYKDVLSTIKVLHLNDSLLFNWTPENLRENRSKRVQGGGMFHWDNVLVEECGFSRENITTAQILRKPWLFDLPGDDGMYHPQKPNVSALDPADQASYIAALDRCRSVYDELAADVRHSVPVAKGMNCADMLAKESLRIDDKYSDAFTKWCDQTFEEVDIICGQGGDVVMTNMAYQVNQPFVKALVAAVRSNSCMYISHSAGTMVTAKSMEMTGEITPGKLEAFAVHKKYLPLVMFNAVDLSEGGSDKERVAVLGALPLFSTPFAMRPHYSDTWAGKVVTHNQMAAKECCDETGLDISTHVIEHSGDNVGSALQLLDIVGQTNPRYQMRPVFVPLRDGRVMEMQIIDGKEVFRALNASVAPSVANPFGRNIAVREKGTFQSNLGWTDSVKVSRGAGSDIDIETTHQPPVAGHGSSSKGSPGDSFGANKGAPQRDSVNKGNRARNSMTGEAKI